MKSAAYIVVTPFFPSPSNWRGSYCYDFVRALMRNGRYDVRVFLPGNTDDTYDVGGVHVTVFRVRHLPSAVFPFLFRRFNERSFLAAVQRAGIGIADIAVCHGHTAFCGIYPLAIKALNPNCLTLIHHHDLASFGLNLGRLRHCWPYNMLMFPVLRRMHEKMDCHVFVSEMSRNSFLSAPSAEWTVNADYRQQMRWLPYRPPRIKKGLVFHNGVDTEKFHPKTNRAINDNFTIGCIGNYLELKGQMTLLKAVVQLHNVKVLLIGSGPMRAKCEAFAREHGIDAEFRNEVPHEQLREFYCSIDLFVLPSYFEGFGCVFTESYACGVPFITCEGQGIDDLVPEEERHFWLCKPMDADDLASKIEYFFKNRPTQHLKGEIAIQPLVDDFVRKIESLRCSEKENITQSCNV